MDELKYNGIIISGGKTKNRNKVIYQNEEITIVETSNGTPFIVDSDKYCLIKDIRWHLKKSHHLYTSYVTATVRLGDTKERKGIILHRYLMQQENGSVFIDHIDGNGMNNRICNLRSCNRAQNKMNAKSHKRKYKGVSFDKKSNIYKVNFVMGCDSEIEAAQIYNEIAEKYYGEFFNGNKLEETNETI